MKRILVKTSTDGPQYTAAYPDSDAFLREHAEYLEESEPQVRAEYEDASRRAMRGRMVDLGDGDTLQGLNLDA